MAKLQYGGAMAEVVQLKWPGTSSGKTRCDRSGGTYEAYLPDRLVGRDFRLEGGVGADVSPVGDTQLSPPARPVPPRTR